MCNHTECVNNPSGAIRHQQFYSPCFSWALGIPAMWCLRIASGVVVGQPGQLGIVQLTIASLPLAFGKARHLYQAALWSLGYCHGAPYLMVTTHPSCLWWGWADTLLRTSMRSQVLFVEWRAQIHNETEDHRIPE